MTNYPAWLADADDAALNRRFGAATVARGRQYAALGRVGAIRCSGTLATAPVRGSGYRTYATTVASPGGAEHIVATCSCPMRMDCKHAVALILTMRAPGNHRPAAAWQQVLASFGGAGSAGGQRLSLRFEWSGAYLSFRPMRLGSRGNWVRTGTSWGDVPHGDFIPAQRDALLGILGCRVSGSAPAVSDSLMVGELTAAFWPALRRAVDSGVALTAGTTTAGRQLTGVELADAPVTPTVAVVPGPDEAVLVQARVTSPVLGAVSLPPRAFLGRPAHGIAHVRDDVLFLAPLARPLSPGDESLFQHGSVTVPSEDVEEFAGRFLPRLKKHLPVTVDDSLELPTPSAPRLLCRVEFQEQSATVGWGFRYGLGSRTVDVDPGGAERRTVARDTATERALADLVPVGVLRDASGTLQPATLFGRPLIAFVTDVLPGLRADDRVDVELNQEPPPLREAEERPQVRLAVDNAEAGDWFDLTVDVIVDGEHVPLEDLMRALAAGDDHLLLDTGTWFPLDAPELVELRQLIEEARLVADPEREGAFRLRPEHAGVWDELVRLGVVTRQAEDWQASVGALLDPASLPEDPVPAGLLATLRPYQETGFRWLRFLWRTGLGGILADEMGLGKTVQALAAAVAAHDAGELTRPMLVVAPTSVMGTWAAEAARFAPGLRTATISATHAKRGAPLAEAVGDADIVVTSYTLLRLEADAYQELAWSAVLLDEAQFVKNHTSKAYQAVRRLNAGVKVALTGTPLENNVMDLWSLLSITAPGLFPDPARFTTDYRKPIESGDAEASARLKRRIRPLILRRTKSAVAAELPDKQEQVVPVELAPGHRRAYDRRLARERQNVLGLLGDLQRNRFSILRSLTVMRQLSLAPSLVDKQGPAGSAKIDTLVEMLDEILAEGHRALVFSQFTSFLSLVRDRLDREGIGYEYLDGRTRDRATRIASFREGDAPVFLISLKAGGFGLTLTEADYVFILDPWWNPAAENQAVDRAHRIGQDKPVNVYRLVSADTIEEKVLALQDRKRHLFDAVIGDGSDSGTHLSADDILALLGR